MHVMARSPIAYLVLVLSIFQIAVIATDNLEVKSSLRLLRRQTTSSTTSTTTTVSCLEYATIANLSTIGTNSSYRAAFQQNSPFGTDKASGILDNAAVQLKDLINDVALNTECGNSTAIAIEEAPKNFTQGIVGPFRFSVSEAFKNGRGLSMVMLAAVVTIGATVLL